MYACFLFDDRFFCTAHPAEMVFEYFLHRCVWRPLRDRVIGAPRRGSPTRRHESTHFRAKKANLDHPCYEVSTSMSRARVPYRHDVQTHEAIRGQTRLGLNHCDRGISWPLKKIIRTLNQILHASKRESSNKKDAHRCPSSRIGHHQQVTDVAHQEAVHMPLSIRFKHRPRGKIRSTDSRSSSPRNTLRRAT